MKRDPNDRILDLALEEVLGGAKPPDLSRRILAATRKPRVLRGGHRRGIAVAAAAVVVVGLAVAVVWPRSDPPAQAEPLARRSGALELVGAPRGGDALRAGDVVVGGAGAVTFGNGAALVFEDDALVRVADTAVAELLAGTVRVRGAATVRTHLGVVATKAGADTRVALPAADFAARVDGWVRGDAPPPGRLEVTVASGRATLDGVAVPVGETARRGPPDEPERRDESTKADESPPPGKDEKEPEPPPLTEEETKLLDSMLRSAFPDLSKFGGDERKKMEIEARFAREQLRRFLAVRPPAWERVRPALLALPRDEHRRGVVEVLMHDPDPAGRAVAEAEVRDHPADIGAETLLMLAEDGGAPARAELTRRLRGKPDDLDLVPAAVWFALRGDARGTGTLRWFLETSRQTAVYPQLYVAAAAGLARLGTDLHWGRAPGFARRTVNRYLENGSLGNARRLVACLSYFHEAVTTGKPAAVADLDAILSARADAEGLKSEADIRARLAALGG